MNGVKYAFYETVMPNSVQEGAINAAGGPVIGKAVGWLGKAASHLPQLWKGIGELAGGLAFKARWFDRPSSKVLRQALLEAGYVPRAGEEAHHIVAGAGYRGQAKVAQDILRKFGIGINEAGNGVFLPKDFHRPLHDKVYYAAVNELFQDAKTREEVLSILDNIRLDLLAGTFP